MSDNTSSSSSDSSDDDATSSSEEESSGKELNQDTATLSSTSYFHEPWLLEKSHGSDLHNAVVEVESGGGDSMLSPVSLAPSSDEVSAESEKEDVSSVKNQNAAAKKKMPRKEPPLWDSHPEIYGVRRSSRQRKEPERLNLKEDDSDDDDQIIKRKRNDSDAVATLTDASDDESSEYESSAPWKKASKFSSRASKLNQMRAKLQGRKSKSARSGKVSANKLQRSKHRRATESTLSEEDSLSEDNQPTRSSQRIQRNNKISYKEHDSTQETDSDDVVEVAEKEEAEGDENTEAIEKIMDHRFGRLGATGSKTTAYTVVSDGDPNESFNVASEEGETQYLIKWKDWSHLHNTWESEATLRAQMVRGLKRLENYMRKNEELEVWLNSASPEHREYFYCQQEMNRNVLDNYRKVDRIIARSRVKNAQNSWDYQVKWCGLPYSECTWEDEVLLIKDFKPEIDSFEMRQDNPCVPKRDCKVLRQRPRFVPMTRQPDWFAGKLKLRDYQLEGVNWLAHSWCKGNSVILADEMGLGKTIQSIVFLSYLYHTHELYGLYLIIVPLSTMTSWQAEFQIWASFMNVIVYMGDQSSRATIREVEWTFPNKRNKFNAILTSYEILLKDKAFLGSHSWSVIAVDEAHRLKNDDSLLYRSLKEFKSNHRLLITGTPLQNSLKELWALLHFIMPEKFVTWFEFETAHAQNRDSGYASLHKVLQPYLLRRVKKDVEKSLPSKVEQILRVPLSSQQKQYYKWILTKNYAALTRGNRGSFSSFCNIVMELKKCCNHAYLVKPLEHEPPNLEIALQNLLRHSSKMVLLDKLLLRLKENGHRVLIFSQMVRMLDIMQEYLMLRRLQFQRLDGSVSSDKRRRALDHFNAEGSEDFCFLLSTRAGGLGINLATADTVIIFDSDWNPMNDLQAQARAHRIGQKNQVNIYRFVCIGSVEEDIIEKAKKKMVLDHLIIQRMDTSGKTVLLKNSTPSSKTNNPFNRDELSSILKFGAEELFQEMDGDEKEPDCDIDEILRRAETRQEQVGSSAGDELLSAFKVATFNLDEEEAGDTGKDWADIIPEKNRKKVEEENRQKEEAQLYLPRRARKKMNVEAGSDSENGSESASSEDDDDDGSLPKRRGRPGRSGRQREGEDYVKGFTTAEVRRFVRSFRKFGDPLSRLDAVARDAELSEQSEADLRRLGQRLYDKLVEMGNEAKIASENISQEPKEEPTKHGRGRGPSFRLAGVSVSVKTTLACIEDLQPLADVISKDAEQRKNFRLSIPVRPLWAWDCSWDIDDDSRLLVGIYEHGMGSWEQIQSDLSLQFDKKILRPNGEKPQAKQLQSRAEYLIKLLRKAQDLNHPGVHPSSTTVHAKNKAAASTDSKPRRKSRKIKSKSRIENDDSDVDASNVCAANPSNVQPKQENGAAVGADVERKKRYKRKRKTPDVDAPTAPPKQSETEVNSEETKTKRRKNAKDNSRSESTSKSHSPKSSERVTEVPVSLPVEGSEEFKGELNQETFRECKERLRPVKRALKQLDRPPSAPEGSEEQVKAEHTRRCLLQIGDRVIECLREYHDPEEIKTLRRNLWIFVSKFTEFNAEKLHRLYKLAIKKRDSDKKDKKHSKHSHVGDLSSNVKKQVNEENKRNDSSKTSHSLKSKKSQNKSLNTKREPVSPPESSRDSFDVASSAPHSPISGRIESNSNDSKSDRNATRSKAMSPQRHFEDKRNRFSNPAHNKHDDRDSRRRPAGRSPPGPQEYRSGRDAYTKHNRSPYPGESRGRSPTYAREPEYSDSRHSRDYCRSPPRRPHERYWRGPPDYRDSSPSDYYPHAAPPRDWQSRYPPSRSSYPHYHPPPGSPGRSPHADVYHRRRPDHHSHSADGRGARDPRYGSYSGSPNLGYSPPADRSIPTDPVRRAEKT